MTWTSDAIGRDVSSTRGVTFTGMIRGTDRDAMRARIRRLRSSCPVDETTQRAYRNAREDGRNALEAWDAIRCTGWREDTSPGSEVSYLVVHVDRCPVHPDETEDGYRTVVRVIDMGDEDDA